MSTLKRVPLSKLKQNDFFSVNAKDVYVLREVEEIGVGLLFIRYSSLKKRMSYKTVYKSSKLLYVPKMGACYRFYE
ncbi:MAG: hypothetical protein JWQ09_1138 [Segetibacter sp.]|nr:hypothetical protein [Segetibacter sp.]